MKKYIFFVVLFIAFVFVTPECFASGPQETDLIIRVKKGKKKSKKTESKKITKKTRDLENNVELYTIEVGKTSRTGVISVQGSTNEVFTTSSGKNVKVDSKVGGIKVGAQ